jgi:hypothetical protein
MLSRTRMSNNCLSWPWLIGIVFLLFIFALALLPDGCHNETNMYYSGCHTARFYGVTCTPNVDCWDHWPHDHSPGPNGSYFAFLVFAVFLGSIFCIFIVDDGNEHEPQSYPHNFTYIKDPIINKHVWKKIEPIEDYPLS